MHHHDSQYNSTSGMDIVKGAIIGAAIAAAVAILSNKDTRRKITKSVKDAMSEMQRKMEDTGQEATGKLEKTTRKMEERFPSKETPVEQP